MNLLLDTHALLWWLDENPTLSTEARAAIADGSNVVFASAASAWEIVIKSALGKLKSPPDLTKALQASRIEELPVRVSHALALRQLPDHHQDPFDRLLIAQARQERLTIVTRDDRIWRYDVPCLRA